MRLMPCSLATLLMCLGLVLAACSTPLLPAPMPITPTVHVPQVSNGLIAFTVRGKLDSSTDIYTMNTDGSDVTRRTPNPGNDSWPVWMPDRERFLYSSDEVGECIDVMKFDGTGNQCFLDFENLRMPINAIGSMAFTSMVWSPDGTKAAFNNHGAILVMNADGSNVHQVSPEFSLNFVDGGCPAWSPDSNYVAFGDDNLYYESGDIYVVKADGTDLKRLNKDQGADLDPYWLPDGTRIVYRSRESDSLGLRTRLYVIDLEGQIQPLLKTQSSVDETLWGVSPDGQSILMTRRQDDFSDVIVLDTDDFSVKYQYQKHVYKKRYCSKGMLWSPDSQQILYEGDHYHVMNVDGTEDHEIVLPFDTDTVWAASWQPVWK